MNGKFEFDISIISPELLQILLSNVTTGKNILFTTSDYGFDEKAEITLDFLLSEAGKQIQPLVCKNCESQAERTKSKAEVFTPSWICNYMNNQLDYEWFNRKINFNRTRENNRKWTPTNTAFVKGRKWEDYIKTTYLEITCGEATYIVSRYDTTTSNIIDVKSLIGILDRKIRVIAENVANREERLKWV